MEIIDTLFSIYAFERSKDLDAFCFMQTNVFKYYLTNGPDQTVSKPHYLKSINDGDYYEGIGIHWLGDDIYIIDYYAELCGEQRLLYLGKQDILIEDLNRIIDTYRKE